MEDKNKSSLFNLNGNVAVLIAYLGGLLFRWSHIACYFAWAIPLIIYLIESKNEFVKKQSSQATLLFLISSICSILTYFLLLIFAPNQTSDIYNMIVTGSLLIIGLLSLVSMIIGITITILAIVAAIKTYNYEDYNIPYLSKYLSTFRKYLELLEGKQTSSSNTKSNQNNETPRYKAKKHKVRVKNLNKKEQSNKSSIRKVQKIHKKEK